MGGKPPEAEESGYREILHGNYRIIYKYDGESVKIVAVRYATWPLSTRSLGE